LFRQKEGGGSVIVFAEASDRATFMAPGDSQSALVVLCYQRPGNIQGASASGTPTMAMNRNWPTVLLRMRQLHMTARLTGIC